MYVIRDERSIRVQYPRLAWTSLLFQQVAAQGFFVHGGSVESERATTHGIIRRNILDFSFLP